MINRRFVCLLTLLAGFTLVLPLAAESSQARVEKFGRTPLVFEPNYGQTDSSVRFLSRGDKYGLFLTESEAVVSLGGATPVLLRMQLQGQNPHPRISGSDVQSGTSQYFKGSDAS